GVAPSVVNSLPMRCSSSKPLISWQPAQPYCLISALPSSASLGSSMNETSPADGGADSENKYVATSRASCSDKRRFGMTVIVCTCNSAPSFGQVELSSVSKRKGLPCFA